MPNSDDDWTPVPMIAFFVLVAFLIFVGWYSSTPAGKAAEAASLADKKREVEDWKRQQTREELEKERRERQESFQEAARRLERSH